MKFVVRDCPVCGEALRFGADQLRSRVVCEVCEHTFVLPLAVGLGSLVRGLAGIAVVVPSLWLVLYPGRLVEAFEPAPDDVGNDVGDALAVPLGWEAAASLSYRLEHPGDRDLFELVIPDGASGGRLLASVASEARLDLRWLDASGGDLGPAVAVAPVESGTEPDRHTAPPSARFLEVTAPNEGPSSYVLGVHLDRDSDWTLEPERSVPLSIDGSLQDPQDRDVYRVVLDAGDRLHVRVTPSRAGTGALRVELLDAEGVTLESGVQEARAPVELGVHGRVGAVSVAVSNADPSAVSAPALDYGLELRLVEDDFGDDSSGAHRIDLAAERLGRLSGVLEQPGDMDAFVVVGPEPGELVLELVAEFSLAPRPLDPVLEVQDPATGVQLAYSDDAPGLGRNARCSMFLEDGREYVVLARSLADAGSGPYGLSWTFVPGHADDYGDTPSDASPLPVHDQPARLEGVLESSDDVDAFLLELGQWLELDLSVFEYGRVGGRASWELWGMDGSLLAEGPVEPIGAQRRVTVDSPSSECFLFVRPAAGAPIRLDYGVDVRPRPRVVRPPILPVDLASEATGRRQLDFDGGEHFGHRFVARVPGRLVVDAEPVRQSSGWLGDSPSFDPVLDLVEPAGFGVLATNDDGGNVLSPRAAHLELSVAPSEPLLVEVRGYNQIGAGPCELRWEFLPAGSPEVAAGTPSGSSALELDTEPTGTRRGWLDRNQEQWYEVRSSVAGRLTLDAVPGDTGFDPVLAGFAMGGDTPIAANDDGGIAPRAARIVLDVAARSPLRVRVAPFLMSPPGPYELRWSFQAR
ncbi:MAG TPA: hypothetical protein VJP77_00185 [Planctomycetota bacterium]|nr:hypothetical protein [Planctomycetota bacterium]